MGINNMNSEISATSNSPVDFDNIRNKKAYTNETESVIEGQVIRGTRKMNLRDNTLVMSEEPSESEENLFKSNRNEWGLTSNNFSEGGADSESEKKDDSETPKSETNKSDTDKSEENNSAFSEGGGDLLDLKRFSDIKETTISDNYTEGNINNHEKFLNLLDNI